MRGAIKASKRPVRVDKTNNECDSILLPPCVVDERRKDELRMLMSWCYRGHGDEDDAERD